MVIQNKVKIKIIKNDEELKIGDVMFTELDYADYLVQEGIAEIVNEEKIKNVKVLVAKDTLKKGKNIQFIEESSDKNAALQILNISEEDYPGALKEITNEENVLLLKKSYYDILTVLKDYSDLKERDYTIIALWIIGTYFYKEFLTYPYLFLNAMKGSGKSRTLRLICSLAWNGQQLGSMTESGLFRTAGKGTMGIDEFEGIAKKENHGLREILNSGYKKGMKIIRMKKVKTANGEEHIPEYFEPYTPIVMANIWGMEEVLGDRCITAILEKSSKKAYVLKMEDFDDNVVVKSIKNQLGSLKLGNPENNYTKKTNNYTNQNSDDKKEFSVVRCSYFHEKDIYKEWNNWVNLTYNYTTTQTTLTTLTTQTTPEFYKFFEKVVATDLIGRDLELFMPLFIIAKVIDDEILEKILEIAKNTTKEKKQEEMMESKDVMLIEFVSKQNEGYYNIKTLVDNFKSYIDYDMTDEYSNWLNPKWMGRALKRLELILDKRRVNRGVEVTLNLSRALEKLKMFQQEK